jgi:hypothetical protein
VVNGLGIRLKNALSGSVLNEVDSVQTKGVK